VSAIDRASALAAHSFENSLKGTAITPRHLRSLATIAS
jgi:hypothetical protein